MGIVHQDSNKWDYNNSEKTHLQYLKRILGVNRSTTNILIRGEINRHSLQEEILRRNIKYAKYLYHKTDEVIVKQAYNFELNRPPGCINFTSTMLKHTEHLHSLHNRFLPFQDPFANIYQISEAKLKAYTYQIFHNEWKSKLDTSTKGETYKRFKANMKQEPYLKLLNRKERVSLTKFRVSDHKLMIEEGRRKRPKLPRENRTCNWCPTNIEDEQHFLTECKLYASRHRLYHQVETLYPTFTLLDSHQKFLYLMSQEDEDITTSLAKVIHDWQQLRAFLDLYFFQP